MTKAEDESPGLFARPKTWFRLGCACLCITVLGIVMTARGMIAAFNRVAELQGTASPADLADGISDSLVWMIVGALFFWPGVIASGVGFWKRYRGLARGKSAET